MSWRLAAFRIGAPVLAVVGGGFVAAVGVAMLALGGLAWQPLLGALIGAGFLAAGVLAAGALWRKRFGRTGDRERHHHQANTAFLAMGALLLATLAGLAAAQFPRFDARSTMVDGVVSDADVRDLRRKRNYRLTIQLAGSSQWYDWSCSRFACPRYQALTALRLGAGDQVQLEVLGERIIGLRTGGRAYLDPAAERDRLRRTNGDLIILALIGLGLMALFGGVALRDRRVPYVGPDPHYAAKAGAAVRRALGRRSGT